MAHLLVELPNEPDVTAHLSLEDAVELARLLGRLPGARVRVVERPAATVVRPA